MTAMTDPSRGRVVGRSEVLRLRQRAHTTTGPPERVVVVEER